MQRLFLGVLTVFIAGFSVAQEKVTISGTLTDASTGEALIYASVYIEGTTTGTSSNEYGFYSLTVPATDIVVVYNYLGYQTLKKAIHPQKDEKINIALKPAATELKEVTISAEKSAQKLEMKSANMSSFKIPISEIRNLPSMGGEVDVIKVMQLLPGVAKGGEGISAMFVRGGDADQNLVILDEAIVYNIGHLFGFFSVFNSDAIKDMNMIKGAFPANFGGRLSSVLDIRMKEGNMKKFHAEGGTGLLSTRLSIEGPIVKDKISFLISGRRTYIDKLFALAGQYLPYYFYDLNIKVNWKISDNDRVYFSSYFGDDVLDINYVDKGDTSQSEAETIGEIDFGFRLGNFTQTLRWNHIHNSKTFSNLSLIHTKFKYDIGGAFLGNSILIKSSIRDIGLKYDFNYYESPELKFKYGILFTNHDFRPNVISTSGAISDALASRKGDLQSTQEIGVYGLTEIEMLDGLLKANLGIRLSGSFVKDRFYVGPEPRIGIRYSLSENDVLKLSYSRMFQYMHRVSSSSVALPTDLWYPISKKVKPQRADQIAFGYNHLFEKKSVFISLEFYYKWLDNLTEFEEGSNLILNDNFENQLLQGKGLSYGMEFLARKSQGKFTGWAAYTLSWSTRQFDELNNGKKFWAKYDRRHSISLVASWEISKRWTFSAIWEYSTGSRFTALLGQYFIPNATMTGIDVIPVFSEKNAVKMSASHRLDINFVLKPKKERKFYHEWYLGAYNLYNRSTPYRINVVPTGDGGYKYVQPGLFGFIPSIALNFKF